MTEFEFLLQDRISKIQAINEEYDLVHNAYISFSGGKDRHFIYIQDNLDEVKAFTNDLILGMVHVLNDCKIDISVFRNIRKKNYVVLCNSVYCYFNSTKELAYFLQKTYLRCKNKIENDTYKRMLARYLENFKL